MSPVIAIVAAGAMGSAVARRCIENGARVLTSLESRGAATAQRAAAVGMTAATDDEIAGADLVFSVVPPAEAAALARRLAQAFARTGKTPVYVDCNAVNVTTKQEIGAIAMAGGARFVDAAIIGFPPAPGEVGPAVYLSGEAARDATVLGTLGLNVIVMEAPVGAASALKMSFAGLNKGMTGLAAAMMLAASRAGASRALREELASSQPQVLARFSRTVPDMYPKAYRWVAEMHEIAEFLGDDPAARKIFEGMAELFARIAADVESGREEVRLLDAFFTAP